MTEKGPFTFAVRGRGQFPLDMLRYDMCYPATSFDAAAMLPNRVTERTRRTVWLRSHLAHEPAVGRWESFGWRVIGVKR